MKVETYTELVQFLRDVIVVRENEHRHGHLSDCTCMEEDTRQFYARVANSIRDQNDFYGERAARRAREGR